jgi:hypothetical protein
MVGSMVGSMVGYRARTIPPSACALAEPPFLAPVFPAGVRVRVGAAVQTHEYDASCCVCDKIQRRLVAHTGSRRIQALLPPLMVN